MILSKGFWIDELIRGIVVVEVENLVRLLIWCIDAVGVSCVIDGQLKFQVEVNAV